ncbi:50S ribosomal protein L25/general stress protein Ctc [Actinomadura sp. WMMB 499]|uniref:50S ribosomal protein L25/general stress protein Ctc n=1 Tax=Actinomadura sp. WMMB 499 TaxID=1219491 RepID=UPI001244D7EC|nr:50S ribosomal protein L25/general stress protein Ctc [Actinomadura sp. WMMB 499]QFG24725.1 50S ribosomal protein L25/general stress protein Ctc [Actinomadura sp. WMMB 499]
MSEVRIAAEPRTEFGKGAARRTRRAGKVPAVLYGHGTDPTHISLPGHELMMALKTPNALLAIEGLDGGKRLALPKDVQRDPIKGFLEHVDLLIVKRGEKVVVDLPVNVTGDVIAGGVVSQQVVEVQIEVDPTRIPESVELDVTGLEVDTQVLAKDLKLPAGTTLIADEEMLIVQINDATVSAGETPEETEAAPEGEGPATDVDTPEASE